MTDKAHFRLADVCAAARLLTDATVGVCDLVETMHATISRVPGIFGPATLGSTCGIPRLVYGSIRGISRLVGSGIDTTAAFLPASASSGQSTAEREAMLAVLNGVLGDRLVESGNALAIPMQFRHGAELLALDPAGLAAALPQARSKILVMVHGLCLNDGHWQANEYNHGALLASEFAYTPVYLCYNSGRHISINGHQFAGLLDALLAHWPVPVEELSIVAHSMGGLVARSACHYGAVHGHSWLRSLQRMVFLGTPHHGAPLERIGNGIHGLLNVSPYSAAFTRLASIRSAGISDLRYGNLQHEDWKDRDRFAHNVDQRQTTPLPAGVRCYAVAATTGSTIGDLQDRLVGDGLVPLRSALGHHSNPRLHLDFPAEQQWIGCNMNHMELLHRPEVSARLHSWFGCR